MTNNTAIGILTTLRNTCAGQDDICDALDIAIESMQRNIVKTDIESIIEAVVRETGVTEQELCERGRQREYTDARAIVAWLAYNYTPMTLTSIGRRIRRNHSMVIHYNHMVDAWLEEPRLNLCGARITTKLIRELEDVNKTSTDNLPCATRGNKTRSET